MLVKRGDQRSEVALGVLKCLNIRLGHPAEPVQAFSVIRRETAQRGDAYRPVTQVRGSGAGQRVRGAARSAYYAEPVNAEMVRDSLDVVGRVRDTAAFLAVRTGIARPVVTDQPDPEPVQEDSARPRTAERAWRPMQQEHGEPVWSA